MRKQKKLGEKTMRMKVLAWLGLIGLCMGAQGVDWAQVERDHNAGVAEWSKRARQRDYVINVTGDQVETSPLPELGMGSHGVDQTMIDDFRKAGVRSIRRTIYWGAVENTETPGVYNQDELARIDKEIKLMSENGMSILVVVHANAPGVSFANRQESYRRFGDFMAFLARRYPQVVYWELWNEMDEFWTDLFGTRENTPEYVDRGKYYAEMLKVVYPVIKEANPAAAVVAGGLAHWSDFPRGIYEGGGKDYFDIMNIHTYGIPVKYQFFGSAVSLRELMDANGDVDKPIWNTEFGAGAEGLTSAWGVPETDTVAAYDRMQMEQLRTCIEIAQSTRLYQRYFLYQYKCGMEGDQALRDRIKEKIGPDFDAFDDLGYTLVRKDGSYRPFFQYLIDNQVNKAVFEATGRD